MQESCFVHGKSIMMDPQALCENSVDPGQLASRLFSKEDTSDSAG